MKQLFRKKTPEQVVLEIHKEIDTAQDRLLNQAKDIIAYRQSLGNQKAERMAAIGFISAEPVISHLKNKEVLVKTKEQAALIEYYKMTYPFQKFITEDELDRICKKYNLIYKPIENYTKDVPEKNLKEIENSKERLPCDAPEDLIWCEIVKDNTFVFVASSGGCWCGIWGFEWYRIPSKIQGLHFNSRYEVDYYLRSEMGFKTKYLVSDVKNFTQKRNGLFIAAPPSHFKGEDKSIFFTEPKDPIVFRFVKGGVQVLTKWGLEADDESLVNEILN